jgi:hypothetical protein
MYFKAFLDFVYSRWLVIIIHTQDTARNTEMSLSTILANFAQKNVVSRQRLANLGLASAVSGHTITVSCSFDLCRF